MDELTELRAQMVLMGRQARAASRVLAGLSTPEKNHGLRQMAQAVIDGSDEVLAANAQDIELARRKGASPAVLDRLSLSPASLRGIAQGLHVMADLPDPIGKVQASWTRPNGLHIERVCTPLGVIGVIYESRPNVTADAAGLCLKSGNAVILRGGSDSHLSSGALHCCLTTGMRRAGLPQEAVQFVPTVARAAVSSMLEGLDGAIDVLVPRGGESLVQKVRQEARVPVFSHLSGNCHLYVDGSADMDMAMNIALNSKLRRTGICGAAETLLLDAGLAPDKVRRLVAGLIEHGCQVRVTPELRALWDAYPGQGQLAAAMDADWGMEYLDAVIAVRLVGGIKGALEHINCYSSFHTDGIVAEDAAVVAEFFSGVDSAVLMHNASTQFSDGGEFGFGGEIGIATGKMHARGPIGVQQLTSFKYQVRGTGQIRT